MERGAWLALASLASLVVGTQVRGALALGEPSERELKARARDWLESGLCGSGEVYHVTSLENLPFIQKEGLVPDAREPGFDGFEAWSKGKVFFTGGPDLPWWLHVMQHSQRRAQKEGPWIVLRLKVGATTYRKLQHDWVSEHECSFFTPQKVPVKDLELCMPSRSGYGWKRLDTASLAQLRKALVAKAPYAKLLNDLENP